MSSLFASLKVKTYRCSKCEKFTSLENGNCHYCHQPLDLAAAQAYEDKETAELKRKLRVSNRNRAFNGLIILIGGIALAFFTLFNTSLSQNLGIKLLVSSILLILFGLGYLVTGLLGWLQNRI